MSSFYSEERAGLISFGKVLLALTIISGIAVGYVGYTAYQERAAGATVQNDFESDIGEVADNFATTISHINHDPDRDVTRTSVANDFENDIDAYTSTQGYTNRYISVGTVEVVSGTRIAQTDAAANFSAIDGGSYNANWEAFSGATDTRQFVIDADVSTIPEETGAYPTFEIGSKEIGVYTDGTVVALANETSGTELCSVLVDDSETAYIDLLNGEVEGEVCHQWEVDDPVSSIHFNNAGEIEGTFSMTYWGPPADAGSAVTGPTDPPEYGDANTPESSEIVYAAVADVTVVENGKAVTRPVVVAPGSIQEEITV